MKKLNLLLPLIISFFLFSCETPLKKKRAAEKEKIENIIEYVEKCFQKTGTEIVFEEKETDHLDNYTIKTGGGFSAKEKRIFIFEKDEKTILHEKVHAILNMTAGDPDALPFEKMVIRNIIEEILVKTLEIYSFSKNMNLEVAFDQAFSEIYNTQYLTYKVGALYLYRKKSGRLPKTKETLKGEEMGEHFCQKFGFKIEQLGRKNSFFSRTC
ncbi:MAG: hypothetical protein JXQ74_04265 [Alphaproteobacteria bacterium]|nr:hypothetical protein [Alphaproteobacteria bacterium]